MVGRTGGWIGSAGLGLLLLVPGEAAAERVVFLNTEPLELNNANGQDPTLDSYSTVVPADVQVTAAVGDLFGGLTVELEVVEAMQTVTDAAPPYAWNLSGIPQGTWSPTTRCPTPWPPPPPRRPTPPASAGASPRRGASAEPRAGRGRWGCWRCWG